MYSILFSLNLDHEIGTNNLYIIKLSTITETKTTIKVVINCFFFFFFFSGLFASIFSFIDSLFIVVRLLQRVVF